MPQRRPVIGIAAALEIVRYSVWEEPCSMVHTSYVDAVQRAGAMAILIPYDPAVIDSPDQVLDLIDGLMLAGGSDLDPATYGAIPHPETQGTSPERDAIEVALANRAIDRGLPVLGICRGMQVLNVARGGTLIQNLPDVVGNTEHRRRLGTFEGNDHQVQLEPGSLAARAVEAEQTTVLSHHHQAIDRLGAGFVITGRSTLDELPEAIEVPDNRYVLGVQWHPEADESSRVVSSLVQHAQTTAHDQLV